MKPLPTVLAGSSAAAAAAAAAAAVNGNGNGRALVHASLSSVATVGRRGRHLTGTFCLTGDTMEGIIQCLVFLKAFSVRYRLASFNFALHHLTSFNTIQHQFQTFLYNF